MNGEVQVLQALDGAQAAFRKLTGSAGSERVQIAEHALAQLTSAPWSVVMRTHEAEQHGWLTQMRECLQHLVDDPHADEAEGWIEDGHWAANELERDLRRMVGAR